MRNDRADLEKRLLKVVLKHTSANQVQLSSNFADLGIDSLELLELVLDAEDEFDVDIPDEDVEGLRTLGDVLSYLEKKT